MDIRILGPVEVVVGERALALGGRRQRALLAILILARNEPVSRDRLIEGIWGEAPPPSASQTLDAYVSRLRKLLGADRIARIGGGYALRVEPGELDLDRFEALAAAASHRDALATWRGPALDGLLFEPFAAREAERLEERRLDVLEEAIDAELAAGEPRPELAAELERLVRDHPERERLIGQLMVALYRAGRQSAALEAYRRARNHLSRELGLEPGPALRELERRILAHDPALSPAPRKRRAQPARRRRRAIAGATAALAAGAALATALAAGGGGTSAAAPPESSSRLLVLDDASARVRHAATLPSAPAAIVVAHGSVWLADPNDQSVLQADPATGVPVDRVRVGGQPGSLASAAGAIWVGGAVGGRLDRIDPATATVSQTVRLANASISAIASGLGALWVADTTADVLDEVDPRTGAVVRTLSPRLTPTGLAAGAGALWVADYAAGAVSEIDPATGQALATIRVGNGPSALALGAGALWVVNSLDSTVSRIDPRNGSVVATIPVGSGPAALAVAGGSVWVASQYSGTVSRIDARRNALVATVRLGGQPAALAVVGGSVWVGAGAAAASHRGGTLRLVSSTQAGSIDPAMYNHAFPPQLTGLVWDKLVTLAQTAGPAGARLVPDLALAVPTPADGGTTYAFRLRPGIRYSDGRPLRASDFRRAIERDFRIASTGLSDLTAIRGARACARRPSRCDLARGIATRDRTGTVVFHLSRPDPDFLYELADEAFAAPLPAGVPLADARDRPLVGTGPYRVASASRRRVVFVRNERFREWSHAAQPDGNPDRIVWLFSGSARQSVAWVLAGRADYTIDLPPVARLGEIRRLAPGLLHAEPLWAVEFLPLNTHVAPFDDIRVRRALNYALDRRVIARMYGGPFVAAPACQPIVPGVLGYRRYCPYTVHPSADGAYHGPDLARARRLVARSGTRGERIDVWGVVDEVVVPPQESAYVGRVLRSLGYRVRVHMTRFAAISEPMRRRFQLSVDGDWAPSFPTPSSYLPSFFSCGGGLTNGYVCDRGLDAEIARALALQERAPSRAARLWTAIDHRIADAAYWVPTVEDRYLDFVSRRVGNYEFNPVWGFIADQAWVRGPPA